MLGGRDYNRSQFGIASIAGGTPLGLGTSQGAQSATLYERASNVLDARILRFAVTARF